MMANLNGSSTALVSCEIIEKEPTMTTSNVTTTSSLDELQKVNDFFEANSGAIERWLREKASDEVINRLHSITRSKERVIDREQHRSSVTSELYQQWLSSSMKVSKN
jgi:hypothetical protein